MFAGGVPLFSSSGVFLGAVGVSGSFDANNDSMIAFAIAEAVASNQTAAKVDPKPSSNTATSFFSTEQAYSLLLNARDAATAAGTAVSIAVIDGAGAVKVFLRQDGATLSTVHLAQAVAKMTIALGVPSETLAQFSQTAVYGIESLLRAPSIKGGQPIGIPT
jgi:uncharacterized protein GlcG (DUF336 family)